MIFNASLAGSALHYSGGRFRRAARDAVRGLRSVRDLEVQGVSDQLRANLGLSLLALGRIPNGLKWMDRVLQGGDHGARRTSFQRCLFALVLSAIETGSGEDETRWQALLASSGGMDPLDARVAALWMLIAGREPASTAVFGAEIARGAQTLSVSIRDPGSHGTQGSVGSDELTMRGNDLLVELAEVARAVRLLLWEAPRATTDLMGRVEAGVRSFGLGADRPMAIRLANLCAARFVALGWIDRASSLVDTRRRLEQLTKTRFGNEDRRAAYASFTLAELGASAEASTEALSKKLRQHHVESRSILRHVSGPLLQPLGQVRCAAELRNMVFDLLSGGVFAKHLMVVGKHGTLVASWGRDGTGRRPLGAILEGEDRNRRGLVEHGGLVRREDEYTWVVPNRLRSTHVTAIGDFSAVQDYASRMELGGRLRALADLADLDGVSAGGGERGRRPEASLRHGCVSRSATGKPGAKMVYCSRQFGEVVVQVERLSRMSIPLLLIGESGAGKDLLARHAHRSSPWRKGPLVCVDCPALAPGLAENELFGHVGGAYTGATGMRQGLIGSANGGMLFLDEVGDLSPEVQAKLLRVLSTGQFRPLGSCSVAEVRFGLVAATNRDLELAVAEGSFRGDLYHRLGSRVRVPPLRKRPDDVMCLWDHFVLRFTRDRVSYEEDVVDVLLRHDWPGNVRELENVARSACALATGALIDAAAVRSSLKGVTGDRRPRSPPPGDHRIARAYEYIRQHGGVSRRHLAALLGVSPRTALRCLDEMIGLGLVERVGRARATRYVLKTGR
jgi:predicted ATP-dependent protease